MHSSDIYVSGFDEECGNQINADDCPECDGDIVTDGGEILCTGCGLIVNEYWLDHDDVGYSSQSGHNRRERTGAPLTPARHDRGLSTEIGQWVDGKGNWLSHSKRRRMRRLRTQHNRGRWRSKGERNLADGFGEIGRLASALDVPQPIRDRACMFFRRAQHENLILGRSIEEMAAASVYAACRSGSCLRTIDELLEMTHCSRSGLQNAYQVLNEVLGVAAKPARLDDFVSRYASACSVPSEVHLRAQELAVVAEETGIANGRKPSGIAAACLYTAGKERGLGITQRELADVANVTAVTIRERYYELVEEQSTLETR